MPPFWSGCGRLLLPCGRPEHECTDVVSGTPRCLCAGTAGLRRAQGVRAPGHVWIPKSLKEHARQSALTSFGPGSARERIGRLGDVLPEALQEHRIAAAGACLHSEKFRRLTKPRRTVLACEMSSCAARTWRSMQLRTLAGGRFSAWSPWCKLRPQTCWHLCAE
jgi:hypothetical protein